MEHVNIMEEFMHEAFGYEKIYTQVMKLNDGSHRHGRTVDLL